MARPKLPERKPSRSVTLKEHSILLLNTIGEGNLSAGIEIALQGYIAFRSMSGQGPVEINPDLVANVSRFPQKKAAKKEKAAKKVAKKVATKKK